MKKKFQKKIILGEPLIPHKSALNLYSKVISDNDTKQSAGGYYWQKLNP